jgi:diguanylate cyclase (GGDEF)-like protein/PAS domain S-box-containing protein
MVRWISLPFITGGWLLFFSVLVLMGWLSGNPVLVSAVPEHINLVFNAALCFFLAGIALLLPDAFPKIQLIARRVIGVIIFLMGLLTLSQNMLDYTLGIDQIFASADIDTFNPNPGRMGNSPGVLFMLVGSVFALWSQKPNKFLALLTKTAILAMLFLGLSSLAGYWLKLEFLYHTHSFLRMSIYGAANFSVLSLGLWAISHRTMNLIPFYYNRDDRKILLVNISILFIVALIGELSGFSVFSNQSEAMLKNNMQESLSRRVNAFNDDVNDALKEINGVVNGASFANGLKSPSANMASEFNLLFMSRGFSAVAVNNAAGVSIYHSGNFSPTLSSIAELHLVVPYEAELFWDGGWVLRVVRTLGDQLGSVTVELPLTNINRWYESSDDLGSSGKFFICAPQKSDQIVCASRTRDTAPVIGLYNAREKNVSMRRALSGRKGEVIEIDPNHTEVFSAYSPIGSFGLGAIVKMDTSVLYAPLRGQLEIIVPIFLLSLFVGMLLLTWQLLPLIQKILISEKKALNSNARLRESESRFRSAFDMSAIGMALVGLDGKWVRVNPSLIEILGYSEAEFLAMDYQRIVCRDDLDRCERSLRQLEHGKTQSIRSEMRVLKKDNQLLWVLVNASLVQNGNHEPLNFIFQIQNIDMQKHAEERLKQMAYHDPLTGLDNRSEIEKNINAAVFSSHSSHQGFALLFLDLDRFKEVNDNYGHDAGDFLLIEVAKRLRKNVRLTDKVGRLGGDEFVLILMDVVDMKTISAIARKILQAMEVPIVIDEATVRVTASLGISLYPDDGLSMETLMKHADIALYCAKEFGKNNHQFFGGVSLER